MRLPIKDEVILAIDFGTSNSLVGYVDGDNKIQALPIDSEALDPSMMRTLLYFSDADTCFYGQKAIREFIENDMEGRLFRSFKAHLPNQAYLGSVIGTRVLSLETMISFFLLELKKRAEKILNKKITKAVIGRPARYAIDDVSDGFAYFRMQKAVALAGFKSVQFVPEPLAAAFDFRKTIQDEKIILIGDFGGGTSDFTIMKIHQGEFNKKDVLALDGCSMAGDALDSVFMSQKLNRYFGAQTKYQMPLSNNILTMPQSVMMRLNIPAHIVHLKDKETYAFIQEVKKCVVHSKDLESIDRLFALIEDNQIFPFFETIESCKKELSQKSQSFFKFDYPDIEISENFISNDFELWSEPIKNAINEALGRCMQSSGLKDNEIDKVYLTGGTSKVNGIRKIFIDRFGIEKCQSQNDFHGVTSGLVEVAKLWQKGQPLYPITEF